MNSRSGATYVSVQRWQENFFLLVENNLCLFVCLFFNWLLWLSFWLCYYMACVCRRCNANSDWLIPGTDYSLVMLMGRLRDCKSKAKGRIINNLLRTSMACPRACPMLEFLACLDQSVLFSFSQPKPLPMPQSDFINVFVHRLEDTSLTEQR